MIGLRSGTVRVVSWEVNEPPYTPPASPVFAFQTLTAAPVQRVVGGTSVTITTRDAQYNRITSSAVYVDQQMAVTYIGALTEPIVWSSSNPAMATVDSNGFVTHNTSGGVIVTATSGGYSISAGIALPIIGGGVVNELSDYTPGSLAKHVSDAVDGRLVDKNSTAHRALFTTQNHAEAAYVRNTTAWPSDLAPLLACTSPWNSAGGVAYAGTAISPLHIIFAAHFQIPTGASIRFITSDNQVVTRTLVSKLTHPSYTPYYPDVTIGRLDSPLPGSIPFARILPDNWATKLPSLSGAATVPALVLDSEEKALVVDLSSLTSMADFSYPNRVNSAKRAEFYEDRTNGDSGNPAFLIINGQLVLLCAWTYGGSGSGTFVTNQRAAINTMMSQLGGSYSLTDVDLSGFPSY